MLQEVFVRGEKVLPTAFDRLSSGLVPILLATVRHIIQGSGSFLTQFVFRLRGRIAQTTILFNLVASERDSRCDWTGSTDPFAAVKGICSMFLIARQATVWRFGCTIDDFKCC